MLFDGAMQHTTIGVSIERVFGVTVCGVENPTATLWEVKEQLEAS